MSVTVEDEEGHVVGFAVLDVGKLRETSAMELGH